MSMEYCFLLCLQFIYQCFIVFWVLPSKAEGFSMSPEGHRVFASLWEPREPSSLFWKGHLIISQHDHFQSGSQGCPPTFFISLKLAMVVWLSLIPTPGDKASGARSWWSLASLEIHPDSQPEIEHGFPCFSPSPILISSSISFPLAFQSQIYLMVTTHSSRRAQRFLLEGKVLEDQRDKECSWFPPVLTPKRVRRVSVFSLEF